MTFTVLKETEKALFIEADAVKTWIPKSWVKKDGALSKRALEKIEDAKGDAEWNKATEKYTLKSSLEAGDLFVEKETEKALMISGLDRNGNTRSFWCPKSMQDNYNFMFNKAEDQNIFLAIR